MDAFMKEIDTFMPEPGKPTDESLKDMIRGLVRFSATRPELNRIMSNEAAESSERLTWLIETHIRPRYQLYRTARQSLESEGTRALVPANLAWHMMLGAASLLHSNAAEAQMLTGIEPSDPETIEAHAEAMVQLFLPSHHQDV